MQVELPKISVKKNIAFKIIFSDQKKEMILTLGEEQKNKDRIFILIIHLA